MKYSSTQPKTNEAGKILYELLGKTSAEDNIIIRLKKFNENRPD